MSRSSRAHVHSIPEVLGDRYRLGLVAVYESGATVYQARDLKAGRDVLVALRDEDSAAADGGALDVRALVQPHPGLTNVLDANKPRDPWVYVVLEVPRGKPLGRLVTERGRYRATDFSSIGCQILLAVSHLHELGLVHGNLHADNVYVLGDDPRTARIQIAGVHGCVRDRLSDAATRAMALSEFRQLQSQQPGLGNPHRDASDDVFELGLLFKNVIDLGPEISDNVGSAGRLLELCNRCTSLKPTVRPANARTMLEDFVECFPRATRARRPAPAMSSRPAEWPNQMLGDHRRGWTPPDWSPPDWSPPEWRSSDWARRQSRSRGRLWTGAVAAGVVAGCFVGVLLPRALGWNSEPGAWLNAAAAIAQRSGPEAGPPAGVPAGVAPAPEPLPRAEAPSAATAKVVGARRAETDSEPASPRTHAPQTVTAGAVPAVFQRPMSPSESCSDAKTPLPVPDDETNRAPTADAAEKLARRRAKKRRRRARARAAAQKRKRAEVAQSLFMGVAR